MRTISTVQELNQILSEIKEKKQSLGLVPTMGALHKGHLSLIHQSKLQNDITIVSIFVNPTQFNDPDDLKNYPRTLEKDRELLLARGVDILFAPQEKEMYPEKDNRVFDFGILGKVMEGAHRPGHFNGVAQIVSKLFYLISPHRAYFGEKDFQQLAIIKQMVKDLNLPVTIIPCPIVREPDGLAMSSRNTLLNASQRKSAVQISKTLRKSSELMHNVGINELKQWVINAIDEDTELKVEYFEIVDDTTLTTVNSWNDPCGKIGCIAVKVGNVRLIDNISYNM